MTIQEMIKAANAMVADEKKMEALDKRAFEAQKKFEDQNREKAVTKEFLSRTYSL